MELLNYCLFAFILIFIISVFIIGNFTYDETNIVISSLLCLFVIPLPALLARRLHDLGNSAWLTLLLLPPLGLHLFSTIRFAEADTLGDRILGMLASQPFEGMFSVYGLVCLILVLWRGNVGPNRFGANPREIAD